MSVEERIEQMYDDAMWELKVMATVARKQTEAAFATLRRRKGQWFRRRK
jgi:hypothetical protein